MAENPIAELIRAHMDRTGDTQTDIAQRGGLSRQTLSGLVHSEGLRSMPRQRTLEALARGLGVTVDHVRQVAASAAYGENGHDQRRLIALLCSYAEGLTDDQLEVLIATTRALARMPEAPV